MTERLIVYRRADERWAWRLEEANGRVIATDGGQGYGHGLECAWMAGRVIGGNYAALGRQAAELIATAGLTEIVLEETPGPRAAPSL